MCATLAYDGIDTSCALTDDVRDAQAQSEIHRYKDKHRVKIQIRLQREKDTNT